MQHLSKKASQEKLLWKWNKIMKIENITNTYKVRKFVETDIPAIYELCSENTTYYGYMKMQPTFDNLKEVFTERPPKVSMEDKYFIGFYKNDALIALMDFCVGYPEEKALYLGWFMVKKELQKTGVGREIIKDFISFLQNENIKAIELGCIKDNVEALNFWKKHGFLLTGLEADAGDYIVLGMRQELAE